MVEDQSFDTDLDFEQLIEDYRLWVGHLGRLHALHANFLDMMAECDEDPSEDMLRDLYDAHYAIARGTASELTNWPRSNSKGSMRRKVRHFIAQKFQEEPKRPRVRYKDISRVAGYQDPYITQFRKYLQGKCSPDEPAHDNFERVLNYDSQTFFGILDQLPPEEVS